MADNDCNKKFFVSYHEFALILLNISVFVSYLGYVLFETVSKKDFVFDTQILLFISLSTVILGVVYIVALNNRFLRLFIIVVSLAFFWTTLNFFVSGIFLDMQETKNKIIYIILHIVFQLMVGVLAFLEGMHKTRKEPNKTKTTDDLKQKLICFSIIFIIIALFGILNSDSDYIDVVLVILQIVIGFLITVYYDNRIRKPMTLSLTDLSIEATDILVRNSKDSKSESVEVNFIFTALNGNIPDTYTINPKSLTLNVDLPHKKIKRKFTDNEIDKATCKITNNNITMQIAHTMLKDTYREGFSPSTLNNQQPDINIVISYDIILKKRKNYFLRWFFDQCNQESEFTFLNQGINTYTNQWEMKRKQ